MERRSTPRFLHISDCHFKSGESYDSDRVMHAFLKSFDQQIDRYGKIDGIFVTDDIANSGKKSEYTQATAFLNQVLEMSECGRESLFVVPGNHDVDRARLSGLQSTLASQEDADNLFCGGVIPQIELAQADFRKWYNEFFDGIDEVGSCSPIVGASY